MKALFLPPLLFRKCIQKPVLRFHYFAPHPFARSYPASWSRGAFSVVQIMLSFLAMFPPNTHVIIFT